MQEQDTHTGKEERKYHTMEKISRSGFLKLAAAAAMSGVTAGALTACNNSASSSTAAASGAAVYMTENGKLEDFTVSE